MFKDLTRIVRNIVRELFSAIIRYSGIPLLIKILTKNKVTILLYHAPGFKVLESHLKYLSKKYNFIKLDDLIEAIYDKNWDNIPKNSVIFTFDDGHKSNFNLLELFKKYKIKPTIFICSQIVNTNRHFWFESQGVNVKFLKNYSHKDRLKYLENKFGYIQEKEYPINHRHALNLEEITLIKNHVDFQSHSQFHPILPSCDDETSRKEIFQSKIDLQNLLNNSQKHFAYPNGDYFDREIGFVKKAGYLSARTINVGWNDINTDPYTLNVIGITDDASVNMMVAQTSGLMMYLSYLVKGSFTGKSEKFKIKKKNDD